MNDKIEALFELPVYYRMAIVIASVALIVSCYYFLIYPPKGEAMAELNSSIETLKLELAEKKGIVKQLPKFEKEVEQLDVELAKALNELPDTKEIDSLLARISDKARDAGLRIPTFEPMPEKMKDFYSEVPVQIEIMGSYHQVATFFDEVARLERIVNMDQFAVAKPQIIDGEMVVTTSAIATSFRFLEESERPKDDKGKSKKRRRRSRAHRK